MVYLQLFGGLVYLLLAGDLLVRGALALAERAAIPPLVVGLTIVAFGTSAPELVISVRAALGGHPELAIGNVVGSNIANVLLVVGLPALIAPLLCDQHSVPRDTLIMLGASLFFGGLCLLGPIGRPEAVLLLAGLLGFLLWTFRTSSAGLETVRAGEEQELERLLGLPRQRRLIVLFLVLGLIGLPLGAELMVNGAVGLAERFELSEAVVGLTVVALGTSLPELATVLVAALHRHSDVAVGNVLGSNVMNLLAIMGTTALIAPAPLRVPDGFLWLDLPVMLGAALLLASFTLRRGTVGRKAGTAFVFAYVGYVSLLYTR